MKKLSYLILIFLGFVFCFIQCTSLPEESDGSGFEITAYKDVRPYTRWWWHAMKFTKEDIENQLTWLHDQGFGGVEISFIYPVNRDPEGERFEWLGEEWQEMVVYAKRCADSLTDELIPFNEYLTKISNAIRFGRTYSDIAVYLPLEDSWVAGILPEELQIPWSWGAYELRYEYSHCFCMLTTRVSGSLKILSLFPKLPLRRFPTHENTTNKYMRISCFEGMWCVPSRYYLKS